jgi:hypothetical protein
MATKITVTLKQAENGSPMAMAETLALISQLRDAPTEKLTLVLECPDEQASEWWDELRVRLGGRPEGIEVEVKRETKESVYRNRMVSVTPMDRIKGFSERHGVESVTLSTGHRSVTLDSATARNAAEMLRRGAGE